LDILQNNLYGVDNAEFAIQIARLRLWLSLVVEFNGETPPPLPNLDFKIEYGDSLAAPDPQGGAQPDMFRQEQIERFKALKARHMRAHDHEKQALHKEIARLRDEIAQGIHPGAQVEGFDWGVEFAEVFLPEKPLATIGGAFNFGQELAEQDVPGGFDIVLANPPYVKQQLIIEQKPTLQKVYPAVYTGTADLYCYFYARALQLLRPGGMLVFISSNKWFRAAYGAKLRKHIAETCRVESITDFGELPVFQNAATFPMIFVAQRIYSNSTPPPVYFTQVKSLEPPYPDVLTLIQRDGQPLPSNALHGADWTLTDSASADRLRKMEKAGVPLRQYVNGQIYRGVVTGLNSAFYITDAKRTELITQDPKSAEIIKPLAVGDNVRRWCINREKWFIVTHTGVDIVRYPAIFAHLQIQQYRLEKRWDKGKHWWELRSCVYYDAFDKPKIVYPDIGKEPRFTLDTEGHYLDATATCIANSDLYLLGLLNSKVVWEYVSSKCAILGDAEKGGRIRLKTFYVEQIPIPDAPQAERQAIAALVQCCLDAKGVGCEAWEKEIDARVAALYGLEL
ncbi:MAG TPA: TaqI-like C-terminal specificity domain-containing protein, partial [Chthonomonadaceae bacterium]|nr:TaqI-like C-terminal specificity domain-containing protein [Chthonomonadaceae bacterium]